MAHFGGVAVGVDLAEVGGLNAEDFGFGLEESTSGVELLEGEVVVGVVEEEEEEVVGVGVGAGVYRWVGGQHLGGQQSCRGGAQGET